MKEIKCVGEAKTRAGICQMMQGNRAMLGELRMQLRELANVLETCPAMQADEVNNGEPGSLLTEVVYQREILEDAQRIVKSMFDTLLG